MKCEKAQEFFSDYIENTLDRPMTVALEAHLNGCEACGADVASLRSMWTVLDQVPHVEPPADFVWRTTTRLQHELLNRREAERAKPLPWWKRLTPVQSFSYAAIAALLLVGMSVPTIPTPLGTRTSGWGILFHPNQPMTAPQFEAQIPGPNGEAAVVKITPTSDLPYARVWMTYEVPVVQTQTLRGNGQPITVPQNLDSNKSVVVRVQRGGASAAKITLLAGSGDGVRYEKTLILPGSPSQAISVEGGDPYYALQQVAHLTGQPLLVDSGLTGSVNLDVRTVAPGQALDQVLSQVGARRTQLPNNVVAITK
jgi:hypothetical protein